MNMSPLFDQLVTALQQYLPGVGPRTAQRMALRLLERDRNQGIYLAKIIDQAMLQIGHCQQCRIWSETDVCQLCKNLNRDPSLLCIVETPADVFAIEQTNIYSGYYFVLMGHLSPLDGMGPEEIGIKQLLERINTSVQEIILATSHTVEGEATAHYITEIMRPLHIKVTRIAHGIPSGGELEFIDSRTLANALVCRTLYDQESK
jgi:recombination protein RecR